MSDSDHHEYRLTAIDAQMYARQITEAVRSYRVSVWRIAFGVCLGMILFVIVTAVFWFVVGATLLGLAGVAGSALKPAARAAPAPFTTPAATSVTTSATTSRSSTSTLPAPSWSTMTAEERQKAITDMLRDPERR